VVAEGGGEVDWSGAAQRADDQVAKARHDLRAGPGAQLGGVLGEGGVAEVVQAVLDRPVPAEVVGEPGRAGLLGADQRGSVRSGGMGSRMMGRQACDTRVRVASGGVGEGWLMPVT
jgi:hypothetical protein